MVNPNRILLNHPLLVERLHLLLLEPFVVFLVNLAELHRYGHLLLLEVVHQVGDQRPLLLLLIHHLHHTKHSSLAIIFNLKVKIKLVAT